MGMFDGLIEWGIDQLGPLGPMLPFGIGAGLTNTENLALQREQFDWSKFQQQHTWNREDNAMQRRAADLQAAGLSQTLAVNGGGAGAGAIVQTRAPQRGPEETTAGIAQIMSLMKMKSDISRQQAEESLIKMQTVKSMSENNLIQTNEDMVKQQMGIIPSQQELRRAQTAQAFQQAESLRQDIQRKILDNTIAQDTGINPDDWSSRIWNNISGISRRLGQRTNRDNSVQWRNEQSRSGPTWYPGGPPIRNNR